MPRGFPLNRGGLSLTEQALVVILPATVFAFVMGSSSVTTAVRYGHNLRWAMLTALAVVSVMFGWRNRGAIPRVLVATVGAFGAVALLSAAWSVKPRLSAEHAISFLLLVIVASFLAMGAVESRRRLVLVLVALVAAPVAAALAGLFVFELDHSLAVQAESAHTPARLRGFGENPNTVAMLLALVLPVVVWRLSATRSMLERVVMVAVAVLLYGTVLASGSRGAMFAAAGGVIVFVLIRVRRVRVLVPLVAVLVAFFAGTFKLAGTRPSSVEETATPPPASTAERGGAKTTTTTPSAHTSAPGAAGSKPLPPESRFTVSLLPNGIAPVPFVPEIDEVGFPTLYESKPILATGSGRIFAWLAALRQGLRRPLLGYGFGTEQYVFADRFYVFDGGYTENSFVGIFLELGSLGVLLLLAPFVLVLVGVLRAFRRYGSDERALIAVGAGTVVAGLLVAFFQSYLYSVGNVATLTFWVILFLAVAVSSRALAPAFARGRS
jgi:O-antigen ligase